MIRALRHGALRRRARAFDADARRSTWQVSGCRFSPIRSLPYNIASPFEALVKIIKIQALAPISSLSKSVAYTDECHLYGYMPLSRLRDLI